MFFIGKNRKKNLIFLFLTLFLFSGVIFTFSDVQPAHAFKGLLGCEVGAGFTDCWNSGGDISNAGDNFIVTGFKWLLYAIFTVFGLLASLAVTIFEWAIKPDNVQLLFNNSGVYESWKFVRDFFNLFFILILLYIAFMVIFQIEKNFKKTLLSLVLAALYINFSYPVSRALIDVTNVPMYFFANQMMASSGGGTNLFGQTMTASNIKGILVPGAQDKGTFDSSTVDVPRLLIAIVFIFLFSITLLVLSVMFVIRLVALVILVIFSSVGFAASIVPGLSSYSKMWWENFWKYAFFGPAAMLMLLVATRFFASLSDGAIMKSMQTVATGTTAGLDQTFFSSMALFSIPIIMLWMAMGLAQTFSIAGASSVVGQGKKFSKWAGSKASGLSAVKRNYASYAAARKSRDDAKNKNNFGSRFGGGFNKKQDTIYGATGLPGSAAARKRVEDTKNKEIYEKAEANKKNGVSDDELKLQLTSGDRVKAAAAAISLSERGAINSANEFSLALKALGNNTKEVSTLIEKADSGAMGMTASEYGSVTNSGAFKNKDGTQNTQLKKQLDRKIVKEGHAKVLVDYELNQLPGGASKATPEQIGSAIGTALKSTSAKDVAHSESLFKEGSKYRDSAVVYIKNQGPQRVQEIEKVSAQEGTSVGAALRGEVPSAEDEENAKRTAEAKRLREKMQTRKRENRK